MARAYKRVQRRPQPRKSNDATLFMLAALIGLIVVLAGTALIGR